MFMTKINSYPVCLVSNKLSSTFNKYENFIFNNLKKKSITTSDHIGRILFDKSLSEIDLKGFHNFDLIINLLKQSSCLNYHESSYFLSIIYSYGIRTESNNTMVLIKFFCKCCFIIYFN